ncbi:MAG: lysylphosphatidylglycerol synthase transmembrane domain-containing protein [Verrucomicrobiota bacterium]
MNFKFLLRCLASLALIWLIVRKLDWHQVGALLQRTDPAWAMAGSMLTLPVLVLLAVRWGIFLRRQSLIVPFPTVFPLTWGGQFFNTILPGSTGGDFVKIYQLCRLFPGQRATAAVTVITDRFTALIALVAMAGTAFLACPVSWVDLGRGTRIGNALGFTVIAGTGLVIAGLGLLWLRGSERRMARLRHLITVLKTSFLPDVGLAAGLGIAFAVHLISFFSIFCFARSLHIGISFTQVLLFMPVYLLLAMLPLTVNGHGLREVLFIFYFGKLGIAVLGGPSTSVQEIAIALSALMVTNEFIWNLWGGLWYFARFRAA